MAIIPPERCFPRPQLTCSLSPLQRLHSLPGLYPGICLRDSDNAPAFNQDAEPTVLSPLLPSYVVVRRETRIYNKSKGASLSTQQTVLLPWHRSHRAGSRGEMGVGGRPGLGLSEGEGWRRPRLFRLVETTDFVKPGIQGRSGSWIGNRQRNIFQLQ